jgi:glutamate N-acetyltransferase/amino-acid N-acetyltransferase
MMAAGRAGIAFDQTKLCLWFEKGMSVDDGLQIVENGMVTDYLEEDAAAIFAEEEIALRLDLGQGSASAVVWTCDLSHDYVSINADYRT